MSEESLDERCTKPGLGCSEDCVYPYCVWCVGHRFTELRPDGGCDDCDDGLLDGG